MKAVTVALLIVALLTFSTYLQLASIKHVDGDGIGITFLSVEIDDRVPTAEIPMYATRFLVASLALAALATIPVAQVVRSRRKQPT